jgi:hypothetical protein
MVETPSSDTVASPTHKTSPYRPAAPEAFGMVAFDIETLGLDPCAHRITAACLYGAMDGPRPGQQDIRDSSVPGPHVVRTFLFRGEDAATDLALREEFMAHLDAARSLCAFNGIRFDIPFIERAWDVPAARVEAWVLKTFDVYEACKLGLSATFSLDRLLAANGLESKTGSGLHAVHLAKTGQWDALGDYCMQDTRLTYLVSSQAAIALPLHTVREMRLFIDRTSPGLFVLW